MKRPVCKKCGASTRDAVKLFRIDQDDLHFYYQWRCIVCDIALPDGDSEPGKPRYQVPKIEVVQTSMACNVSLDIIPRMTAENAKSCRVCGAPASNAHHWLPQAYGAKLEDYDNTWANVTDYLCPKHHHQWHIVVTPTLTKWHD